MVNVTYDAPSGSIISTDLTGNVYVYNPGDISWTLATAALVWIMIPGCGFFYSGFLRRKNALSMLYLSTMTFTVVSLQWFFWGYSLVYSETGGPFWGNLRYFGLRGVLEKPPVITNKRIPSIVFCVHQLMFAAFTAMVAIGAVAERVRHGPLMVFIFLWSTLVYDPIARWTWNPHGWSFNLGGLDFAGGTPVHITSGATALALSCYLRIRKGVNIRGHNYPPNNISYIYLGTALMWFGWLGFNGGSALSANFKAAQSIIVTNIAASAGGLTYLLLEYHQYKKWSVVSFCTGVIDGLVAITPAAGYVGAPAALVFGVVAAIVCKYSYPIPLRFNLDDALGIFQHHCIGGLTGNLLTGLFAQKSVAGFDGITDIKGGFLDHNYIQLGYQLLDSIVALIYAFLLTLIIVWVMHFIPPLRLRLDNGVRDDDASFTESIYDYRNDTEGGEGDLGIGQNGDMEMNDIGQEGVNGGPPPPQHQ